MKQIFFVLLLMATALSMTALAQVPQQFAFQGVARNSNGQAVTNQKVSVRFTIHQGTETGGNVFQETHTPTTSATGIFNVAIGSKTAFPNTLNWSNNAAYYLQVEIDPTGGNTYTTISISQLLSVPYAIAASRLVATGSTVSSSTGSTMGTNTIASGLNATAMGWGSEASGTNAFAVGYASKAIQYNSVSMGEYAKATGIQAFAVGSYSEAAGDNSVAVGPNSKATGKGAMALGYNVIAGGDISTAMGNSVSTGSFQGSFIIGDWRPQYLTSNTAENQMIMRFGGGYRFYTGTSGNGSTIGVALAPNGNSWASISDSTKKENYKAADGAAFLLKIKDMKLGSWNYKGQDKQQYRHYGPMAQEFYSLFGNDGTGIIGNDTTIASADIDGVIMIALQALVKQTETMKSEVTQLKEANKKLRQRLTLLEVAKKEN
ncbi:tail fiber domain-containing protein [Niabella drilacis]|nr:tail fiber domain-containing protein [Niabella drilacis]